MVYEAIYCRCTIKKYLKLGCIRKKYYIMLYYMLIEEQEHMLG